MSITGPLFARPAPSEASVPTRPRRVIVRQPMRRRIRLRDVFGYGPLLRVLALRDLRARYKQSVLGPVWVVTQPLTLLAGFAVGFKAAAGVDTGSVPYGLFVIGGLVVYSYFQAAMMMGTPSVVQNFALVRYTSCPRLALPLATLFSTIPSMLVPLIALLIGSAISGNMGPEIVLLPLCLVWLLLFVAASVVVVSALTVRARDM